MLHNNWLYSSRRSLYLIIVEIYNFLSLLSSWRTQARREHRKNRRKRRKSYPYAFLAQVLGDSGTCYGNIVVTENVVFKARFKRRISVESNSIRKLNATEMFESIAFDCVKLESSVPQTVPHLRQKSDTESNFAFVSCGIQCIRR